MRDDFAALWAQSPGSLRRDPSPVELSGGIPCGPFDKELLNEMYFTVSSMLSELNTLLDASGIVPDEVKTNQLLQVFGILSPRLSLNTVIYVRSDGSDTNDGSANDPSHAVQTIAQALTLAQKYVLTVTPLTIQLGAPGTFTLPAQMPGAVGKIILRGDPSAQSSYSLIGPGPSGGGGAIIEARSLNLTLRGVTITNGTSTNATLAASAGGQITVDNVTLIASVGSTGAHHLFALQGSAITVLAGCIFNGSMATLAQAVQGGNVTFGPYAITIANGPTYSVATIAATETGTVAFAGGASFTGSATGKRFLASSNGVIRTNGAGANYIPGTVAGEVSVGGVYF